MVGGLNDTAVVFFVRLDYLEVNGQVKAKCMGKVQIGLVQISQVSNMGENLKRIGDLFLHF